MDTNNALRQKQCRAVNGAMDTWPDDKLISMITSKLPNWRFAFTTLSERHQPWIFNRCLYRLQNYHDAEDATQDILLRIYNKLHQFQHKAQFRTWINTITDNYCNTFAVRRSRYFMCEHIDQLIEIHLQADAMIPNEAYTEQLLVRQVLSMLPENTRQVLSLRFYGQYSLDEIARILSLTLSAAKARLYRAMGQFVQRYERMENPVPPLNSVRTEYSRTGS